MSRCLEGSGPELQQLLALARGEYGALKEGLLRFLAVKQRIREMGGVPPEIT